MKKIKKNKPKITKEQLKYKEWENYNKGDKSTDQKDKNVMYHGNIKGNRWGW